jgi:hypothetical protein
LEVSVENAPQPKLCSQNIILAQTKERESEKEKKEGDTSDFL